MPKKLNIPELELGQLLKATYINQIVEGVNETNDEALTPSHAFDPNYFVENGTTVLDDGTVVPKLSINPSRLEVFMNQSQWEGNGTESNPYTIKDGVVGATVPNLGQTTLTGVVQGIDSIKLNWTEVLHRSAFILERSVTSNFTSVVSLGYIVGLTYTDVGLANNSTYFYRVKPIASGYNDGGYSVNSFTTLENGNTTPAPPTLSSDDTANTLSASHVLGTSEIVVSINNAGYIAYAGPYAVGNVNLAAGYYKFKIKSATGRNESSIVASPAFTLQELTGIQPLIFTSKIPSVMTYDAPTNTYNSVYQGSDGWGNNWWNSGKKLMPGVEASVYMKGGDSVKAALGFSTTIAATYYTNMVIGFTFASLAFPDLGSIEVGGVTYQFNAVVTGTDYRLNRTAAGVWTLQSSTDNWGSYTIMHTFTYTGSVVLYPCSDMNVQVDNLGVLGNPRQENLTTI